MTKSAYSSAANDIISLPHDPWIDTLEAVDPKTFLDNFLKESVRSDGRTFSSSRPVSITKGVLQRTTAGSALVRKHHGPTAICGVTLRIGQPSALFPKQGDLFVTLPSGGNNKNNQQQQQQSIAIESWMQRILSTSNMIDLTELCIQEGRAAWRLQLTILELGNNDNAPLTLDVALLAAVAALLDTKLPSTKLQQKSLGSNKGSSSRPVFEVTEPKRALPFNKVNIPNAITIGLYKPSSESDAIQLIVDPSTKEYVVLEGTMTIVVAGENILGMQHAGHVAIRRDLIALATKLAIGRGEQLQAQLMEQRTT